MGQGIGLLTIILLVTAFTPTIIAASARPRVTLIVFVLNGLAVFALARLGFGALFVWFAALAVAMWGVNSARPERQRREMLRAVKSQSRTPPLAPPSDN